MRNGEDLSGFLGDLEGRSYNAYKGAEGAWRFPGFTLHVDHVQGDPFADPSRLRAVVPTESASLPATSFSNPSRALGTAALLARTFADAAASSSRNLGSGRSGQIRMVHPGQVVLAQTAVQVDGGGEIDARFTVGLPARGRRISGVSAAGLVTTAVELIEASLFARSLDAAAIERCAATNEDAAALRDALDAAGLVAFVENGSILPRRSGIDDRPLDGDAAVPFRSPKHWEVSLELPNAGSVSGMGIRTGITLITGGGFHGKSTLLRAVAAGVHNHRPGDGRECVVTRRDAVKIRAEDGRAVSGVDISPFIDGLPLGRDTGGFSTRNASGSTSQAAAIIEGLEAGTRLLLIDEDTSASNFMIRDRRMQALVPKDIEPITPLVDRVRDLSEGEGVSCVVVLGGSGDYLDVADRVVRMRDYVPEDVTDEAARVVSDHPTGRLQERTSPFRQPRPRQVHPESVDPARGKTAQHIRVPDDRTLLFGSERIDVSALEQVVNRAQLRAIGLSLASIRTRSDGRPTSVPAILDSVMSMLDVAGLDGLQEHVTGDLCSFRRFEVAATLNRLRTLRVE